MVNCCLFHPRPKEHVKPLAKVLASMLASIVIILTIQTSRMLIASCHKDRQATLIYKVSSSPSDLFKFRFVRNLDSPQMPKRHLMKCMIIEECSDGENRENRKFYLKLCKFWNIINKYSSKSWQIHILEADPYSRIRCRSRSSDQIQIQILWSDPNPVIRSRSSDQIHIFWSDPYPLIRSRSSH